MAGGCGGGRAGGDRRGRRDVDQPEPGESARPPSESGQLDSTGVERARGPDRCGDSGAAAAGPVQSGGALGPLGCWMGGSGPLEATALIEAARSSSAG